MPEDPRGHAPTFESAWADLARRLENALVADRVPRPLAEDVVQETGIRLFELWDRLDTSVSLMPLAMTIARNLVVDHYRKHERIELRETPQEVVAFDVEERALARIHLGAVHRALRKLNPRYRSLLLAEAGYEKQTSAGGATRTARTRARQGLKMLMERAPDAAWAATGPIAFYRRSAYRIRRLVDRQEWAALGQVAAAAALLFVASLPPSGAIAEEPPARSGHRRTVTTSAQKENARSAEVSKAGTRVANLSDGRAERSIPGPSSTEVDAGRSFLPPIPKSKGHHTSSGSLGVHGFDETAHGTNNVAGEDVDWKYHAEYRSPECVREAAEGNVSAGCDTSSHAEGNASVRHREREVSAGTPDGDRS